MLEEFESKIETLTGNKSANQHLTNLFRSAMVDKLRSASSGIKHKSLNHFFMKFNIVFSVIDDHIEIFMNLVPLTKTRISNYLDFGKNFNEVSRL